MSFVAYLKTQIVFCLAVTYTMTYLLSNPRHINGAGRLFASVFARQPIDAVMTVATKKGFHLLKVQWQKLLRCTGSNCKER